MSKKLRVFYHLQVAYTALFRAADHRARQNTGLTITQIAVLFLLNEKDGQPVSEIAARLSMGKSSLTGLIDRLWEKRLVRRSPCPKDGRVTLVFLEDAGRRAAKDAGHHTRHYNAALLAPFTDTEQEVIGRFLKHIAENADTIINGQDTESSGTSNVKETFGND